MRNQHEDFLVGLLSCVRKTLFPNEGGGCLARACEPNKPQPEGHDDPLQPRLSLSFRRTTTTVLLQLTPCLTSALHLGGLGAALLDYLYARGLGWNGIGDPDAVGAVFDAPRIPDADFNG